MGMISSKIPLKGHIPYATPNKPTGLATQAQRSLAPRTRYRWPPRIFRVRIGASGRAHRSLNKLKIVIQNEVYDEIF